MVELFKSELVTRYIEGQPRHITNLQEVVEMLIPWVEQAKGDVTGLTEENLDLSFLQALFVGLLGYSMPPGHEFSLVPKKALEARDTPDFRLGSFKDEDGNLVGKTIAVGELKSLGRDLDRVDPRTGETPVQQAFRYGRRSGLDVAWVIVSDMNEIRLYRVNSEMHYSVFRLEDFIEDGVTTDEFWRFYHIMKRGVLLLPLHENPIANLVTSSTQARIELTDAFYKYYRRILTDVFQELIAAYPGVSESQEGKEELAQAAQQFLHRGLMICFMSDHPDRLLPAGLLDDWIQRARDYEALGDKIYPSLKALFKFINEGNRSKGLFGYDGGLFEKNPYLDAESFNLPDELFSKEYMMNGDVMEGVYGFRAIDFFHELSPHLLGRLFENSIADQEEIFRRISSGVPANSITDIQGDLGVVYTREVLARFASQSSLKQVFTEKKEQLLSDRGASSVEELGNESATREFWSEYADRIKALRIVDLSVGSGAFLVESYRVLKQEIETAYTLSGLGNSDVGRQTSIEEHFSGSELLEDCLFGMDILPGAVSVAELALWLASARKGIPLTNFQDNFLVGDTLDKPGTFPKVEEGNEYQKFDLVVGNPPWGGIISPSALEWLRNEFPDVENPENLNTFEWFLLVGSRHVQDGGHLCYILPHAFLNPQRREIRKFMLEKHTFEKLHYLGADWFGPDIRMNTLVLQVKKQQHPEDSTFLSMLLSGQMRKNAIRGEIDLEHLETYLAYEISQRRCVVPPDYLIEVFRYEEDDRIMGSMDSQSRGLGEICSHGRGIELNKAGLVIQCPSCGKWLSPPRAALPFEAEELVAPGLEQDVRNAEKKCRFCGVSFLLSETLDAKNLVSQEPSPNAAYYIDGDGMGTRYRNPQYAYIELGLNGVNYKPPGYYRSPKILIRQAGVGLTVCYDDRNAYCPRSVYIYSPSDSAAQDYGDAEAETAWSVVFDAKFLLGVLNSRIFHYYLFKRYAEVDAAQAFSKVNHEKLAPLPIPVRFWNTTKWRENHDRIVSLVDEMMESHAIGGAADWEIERILTEMYGLDEDDRKHIMGQFGLMEYHQAVQSLFPDRRPPRPDRSTDKLQLRQD